MRAENNSLDVKLKQALIGEETSKEQLKITKDELENIRDKLSTIYQQREKVEADYIYEKARNEQMEKEVAETREIVEVQRKSETQSQQDLFTL